MKFQFFSEKIEFSKLNLKIEFHEPLNGSWKVLGCNTANLSESVYRPDLGTRLITWPTVVVRLLLVKGGGQRPFTIYQYISMKKGTKNSIIGT